MCAWDTDGTTGLYCRAQLHERSLQPKMATLLLETRMELDLVVFACCPLETWDFLDAWETAGVPCCTPTEWALAEHMSKSLVCRNASAASPPCSCNICVCGTFVCACARVCVCMQECVH